MGEDDPRRCGLGRLASTCITGLLCAAFQEPDACAAESLRLLAADMAGLHQLLPGRTTLPAPNCTVQGHLARVGEERCAFVRAMVSGTAARFCWRAAWWFRNNGQRGPELASCWRH